MFVQSAGVFWWRPCSRISQREIAELKRIYDPRTVQIRVGPLSFWVTVIRTTEP